jgi:hypothetical protein
MPAPASSSPVHTHALLTWPRCHPRPPARFRYISEGLELRESEVTRLRADEQRRVLGSRKLFLILDLDHTLLNSARAQEARRPLLQRLPSPLS